MTSLLCHLPVGAGRPRPPCFVARNDHLCQAICRLAMKCYVEATNLILFRDAHWSEEAQHLQDAKADHKGISARNPNGKDLNAELVGIALNQTLHTVDGGAGKHTGENRAKSTADAVYSPDIQRVVPVPCDSKLDGTVTDDGSSQADDRRCSRRHEPGRGSDSCQSGNRAGHSAGHAWLLISPPRQQHPGDHCH
jgi:hypothetical protein